MSSERPHAPVGKVTTFAMALLVATALTGAPALADGGNGGDNGIRAGGARE